MSKVRIIEQSPEPWENPRASLIPLGDAAVMGPGIPYSRLRELSEDYRDYLSAEDYTPGSVTTYAKELERFLSWLEANPQAIGRETFLRYREDLKSRYSPSTVNLAMAGIRKYLNWLLDIGEIPNNPALGVKGVRQRGRGKAHKKDALTPGEARRLLALIPTDSAVDARDRQLLCAMLYGGLRTIEARTALIRHYKTRQAPHVTFLHAKGKS